MYKLFILLRSDVDNLNPLPPLPPTFEGMQIKPMIISNGGLKAEKVNVHVRFRNKLVVSKCQYWELHIITDQSVVK